MDEVDRKARARVAADEAAARRRRGPTLAQAAGAFVRHPSPWIIAAALAGALASRIMVGDWNIGDALVPIAMVAAFPFVEWLIHVCILHWKPRHVGAVTIDPLLARKHREHHRDPRDMPLVFIPWQTFLWLLPALVAIAVLAFPRVGLGLTYLVAVTTLGLLYEWTHYLIHSDYQPKSKAYKAIWRNHRLHHYRNEHYWFSITTTGTSDRILGTYPRADDVAKSPTAKNLHGAM